MGGRRSFFTGALAPYRWRELMSQTLSAGERMTRFADGLELLGGAKKLRALKKHGKKGETEDVDVATHLPQLFHDIFRNAFLKFRDGRILTLFLTELGGFTYLLERKLRELIDAGDFASVRAYDAGFYQSSARPR